MTILWSERAIDRLSKIHDYLADDSKERARALIARLFARVEMLRAFPEAGRALPEFEHLGIREALESSYRILYRIADDRIEIVNILHSRQRY